MSEITSNITITEPLFEQDAFEAALGLMVKGAEFDTPNGEMPDGLARWTAQALRDYHPVLADLADGKPVGRDALSDAVGAVGRRSGWPVVQEYLATWVLNHD